MIDYTVYDKLQAKCCGQASDRARLVTSCSCWHSAKMLVSSGCCLHYKQLHVHTQIWSVPCTYMLTGLCDMTEVSEGSIAGLPCRLKLLCVWLLDMRHMQMTSACALSAVCECAALSSLGLRLTAGSVPMSWTSVGAFPALSTLVIVNTSITGTLPSAWGDSHTFLALQNLYLQELGMTGTLPAEWGSTTAFQSLESLVLSMLNITGDMRSLTSCDTVHA